MLESLLKLAIPGAHIACEYRKDAEKDYWRAAESEGTKAVLYATAGIFAYTHGQAIIGFLHQHL